MEQVRYVDEKEASRITGKAIPTLRNDRHMGRGIPYIKMKRSVRYRVDDIVAYMEKHRIETED